MFKGNAFVVIGTVKKASRTLALFFMLETNGGLTPKWRRCLAIPQVLSVTLNACIIFNADNVRVR